MIDMSEISYELCKLAVDAMETTICDYAFGSDSPVLRFTQCGDQYILVYCSTNYDWFRKIYKKIPSPITLACDVLDMIMSYYIMDGDCPIGWEKGFYDFYAD